MSWYVYIAECADRSLYTGVTTNPRQRLLRHNRGRGSAYVRSRGAAVLRYVEPAEDRSAALHREREIKAWRREKKLLLLTDSGHG